MKTSGSLLATWLLSFTSILGLVVLWIVAAQVSRYPTTVFPTVQDVATGVWEEVRSGRLAENVVASLFRVAVGFVLAVVLGVPLGLWIGHCTRVRATLMPALNFFRSLSPVAWVPFAILWFGIGDAPAIFLIVMATLFPLALATAAAVAHIPSVYFRVARDYGFRGPALLRVVTLPAILPQLITALRLTLGLAWLVVVAAEMIAGRDGLGFAIWDARNSLRTDLVAGGMIVIGVIGVALDRLMLCLTRLPSVRWGYER